MILFPRPRMFQEELLFDNMTRKYNSSWEICFSPRNVIRRTNSVGSQNAKPFMKINIQNEDEGMDSKLVSLESTIGNILEMSVQNPELFILEYRQAALDNSQRLSESILNHKSVVKIMKRRIQILIQCGSSKWKIAEVDITNTAETMRDLFENKFENLSCDGCFLYNNNQPILNENRTILECGIQKEANITLDGSSVFIKCQNMDDKPLILQIGQNVDWLKKKLGDFFRADPANLELNFNNRILEDVNLLTTFGLGMGSVINCIISPIEIQIFMSGLAYVFPMKQYPKTWMTLRSSFSQNYTTANIDEYRFQDRDGRLIYNENSIVPFMNIFQMKRCIVRDCNMTPAEDELEGNVPIEEENIEYLMGDVSGQVHF